MFRLIIRIAILAVLLGILAVFTVLPGFADRQRNRVATPHELMPVDSVSRFLHGRITVVDLHADALLWPRDLLRRSSHGHVDLPRLNQGNVAIQLFGVVTQVPPKQNYQSNPSDQDQLWMLVVASRWPFPTWRDRLQRALHQATRLHDAALASRGSLTVVRSRKDLETLLLFRTRDGSNVIGGLLALEGLHPLGGNLARLDTLFDAGFRVGGLTHFFDNEIGGSSAGRAKGGLTRFGRDVIARMERLGMTVDLAHASPRTLDDVLSLTRKPVIVSHTGVQATCPGPRNLSDTAIRKIAANGGVIGIGFWDAAVCDISPEGIVRAIRHVVSLVGADHAALGSDFDGATTTAFDASQLNQVTAGLRAAGLSEREIRAIMGENALRVLFANLPPG